MASRPAGSSVLGFELKCLLIHCKTATCKVNNVVLEFCTCSVFLVDLPYEVLNVYVEKQAFFKLVFDR